MYLYICKLHVYTALYASTLPRCATEREGDGRGGRGGGEKERDEIRVRCPGSLRIANFRQVFVREIQPTGFAVYKVALEDRVDS